MKRLNFSIKMTAAVLFFMTAFISASEAQFIYNHQRVYDPLANSNVTAMAKTTDGGYVIVGTYLPAWSGVGRAIMMKLDGGFSTAWSRTFDVPGAPYPAMISPRDVYQTLDRGYIICGKFIAESLVTGSFLMKTNYVGDVQWFQVYPEIQQLNSVVQTTMSGQADGYAAGGFTRYDNNETVGVILRTDVNGGVTWKRYARGLKYSVPGAAAYNQIIRYDEEYLALTGYANYDLAYQDMDVLLTVISHDGVPVLHQTYGMYLSDKNNGIREKGVSLVRLEDGTKDLVITGNYTSAVIGVCTDPNFENIFAFRVNSGGQVLWARHYGPRHTKMFANRIELGRKDDLYITGWTRSNSLGAPSNISSEVLLLKINDSGTGIYREMFGDDGQEGGVSLVRNNHGHMVIAGNTTSFNSANNEIYLIERYDHRWRTCKDSREKQRTVKILMPALEADLIEVGEEAIPYEVESIVIRIDERVLCEKRKLPWYFQQISIADPFKP